MQTDRKDPQLWACRIAFELYYSLEEKSLANLANQNHSNNYCLYIASIIYQLLVIGTCN